MKASANAQSKSKSVGIYIRVSTEDQANGESPEHHERRAHLYAESKGWHVCEVYHLEGVSGKAVMGHPEVQRMLADVRAKRISGLVFSKLARLARNTKELLEFADVFREHNADLISLHESIDTSTPAGRLFFTVVAALSQFEREEIAERVAASVPIRAKLGKPLGGAAPFGYKWENRTLVPDPNEAPIRKRMYELFLEHRRKKTVARLLNESGYRARKSKFSDTTVDRLLRDTTAKGIRRANYTKSLGDKKHWKVKPREEWVETPVEAIISEELWAQCNAILDASREAGQRPTRKTVHLFSGLAHCSWGQKMFVPSNSPKYICAKCRTKIALADLEGVFHEELQRFFLSPTEISDYIRQCDSVVAEKEDLVSSLRRERDRVKSEMDQTYRLYLDGNLSSHGFGVRNGPLEERLKQIDHELPRLQGEIDFLKIQYLSSDQVLTDARDLYSGWGRLDPKEKRSIVEAITERITISSDEVAIDLNYAPYLPKNLASEQRNLRGSSPLPS